ncbi:MAG: sensor hybrid histidine kinase [Massilia sp.]|nr:sensor hybrid histidine kinase [Massilia sp.]
MFAEASMPITACDQDGEMARLIAGHDWAASPLGSRAGWPRALHTTVDLMLASQFPMFVAWGAQRCLLYNDAYSNILGRKHPQALGMPFKEAWADIWHEVGPIADRAFANQPSYFQDLPIQMERNGYPELTYFTFSYSGVRGDSGAIEGMFCVCQETTASVLAEKQRLDEMDRLRQLFEQAPGFMAMLRGPRHVFEMANAAFLQTTGFRDLIGKPIRAALPELAGQGLYELLDHVYASGEPYVARGMAVKVQRDPLAPLEDVFVNFIYQPIVAAGGTVTGIFVEGSDVTGQHLAQQDLARNIERLEQVERRKTFQLELADRLRDLARPEEITAAASEILGRWLAVDRVIYAEATGDGESFLVAREWLADGVASVARGVRRLDDFGPPVVAELRAGLPIAVDDVRFDPRTAAHSAASVELGVIATIGVPLVKSGRLVAILNVQLGRACHWTDASVELARETADRTWAALERARARAELKAQRDRSQHILKNMIEGFMLIDHQSRVVQINAEALTLGERAEHEVLGRHHLEVWPEAAGTDLDQLYRRVAESGQPSTLEYGHAFPHGRRAWFEVRCHRWLDGGVAVFFRDISERKQSEQSLLASERAARQAAEEAQTERRLLDTLLDAIPVGIGMAAADGELVRVNRANRRLWGEALPAAANAQAYETWKGWWADGSARQGRRLEAHEWALARVLRGEEAPNDVVEIEPFGTPGVRRTIVLSAAAVRDAGGNIVGGVVAQIDVTAREQAEKALRQSEAKFRTIANALPHMVFSTLPDGEHDYFNQQWFEFTGVAKAGGGGDGWPALFHPDDRTRAQQRWRLSLDSGEPYEMEYRLRHHSGQYRWVLARALPIRDDAGAIVRWMGASTDIHDQKSTQEALRLADRRKDEFLAMLAHELRNPLAPISAGADLLRMTIDEPRVRQISELISRQVKHMTSLVDDLMDVSRVTRGLVTLNCVLLDVRDIVTDAVEQVRPLIDAGGHRLAVHIPPGSALVLGDQKRLIQVVTNVLNNAAKYTPRGGSIALTMAVTTGEVVIEVADNGIGMSADMVGRVFELFTQAERSSDRAQGGLGIGLALVKSLVELHAGSVTASSGGLEQGSEFSIRLPRAALPQQTPGPLPEDGPANPAPLRSLRVMVVDDNVDAATMLGMFLESAGHQVFVEHDATRALACAGREQPDVCLLDIGLPDMDGNELARRLRAQPGGVARVLVAITGYGQEEDRRQSAAAGFDHHFVKPVDAEVLLALLGALKPA